MTTTMTMTEQIPGRGTIIRKIAAKELSDALRNRLFLIAAVTMLGLALIAVLLGAVTVRAQMSDYLKAVDVLKSLGRTDYPEAPSLNPLAVSKSFINYLAMVGALLATILGFSTIRKERQAGTLPLLLSRPVFRDQLLTGKILGNALMLGLLMLLVGAMTYLAITIVGRVSLTVDEFMKLALTMLMSWFYLLTSFALALLLSLVFPDGNKALLLTIIIWLIYAFVFPQIGDTMDIDNQLPGGFFATLGLDRAGEEAALAQFKWYETVRDGIEQLSPTKHYERISFALLGVKKAFIPNTWLEIVQLKLIDIAGLLLPIFLLFSAAYVVFLRKDT